MGKNTSELRKLWAEFECAEQKMEMISFSGDRIRVAPPTVDAWRALEMVLQHHGYSVRPGDTDSYNCRPITGGTSRSLHSYGIALDINWTTNPFKDHEGERELKFSPALSQADRALDVKRNLADSDMTPAMIADVRAISTIDGLPVFEWGGAWKSVKDAMHFEIDLSPEELARGIKWQSVAGYNPPSENLTAEIIDPKTAVIETEATMPIENNKFYVTARNGVRRRAIPDGEIIGNEPYGQEVYVISQSGSWALVDLQGDGAADGYIFSQYLSRSKPAPAPKPPTQVTPVIATPTNTLSDKLAVFTPTLVKEMFPATTFSNIQQNLPFVISGLRARGLVDESMCLVALATIRAETEGFLPIPEARSKYNTRVTPFDIYDKITKIGNIQPGDGARFKGRGYVQLTGRSNYGVIGKSLGVDLLTNPDLACDPKIAGLILAEYLRLHEAKIRKALASNNLADVRYEVNGGAHGIDRFKDAYNRGAQALQRAHS